MINPTFPELSNKDIESLTFSTMAKFTSDHPKIPQDKVFINTPNDLLNSSSEEFFDVDEFIKENKNVT